MQDVGVFCQFINLTQLSSSKQSICHQIHWTKVVLWLSMMAVNSTFTLWGQHLVDLGFQQVWGWPCVYFSTFFESYISFPSKWPSVLWMKAIIPKNLKRLAQCSSMIQTALRPPSMAAQPAASCKALTVTYLILGQNLTSLRSFDGCEHQEEDAGLLMHLNQQHPRETSPSNSACSSTPVSSPCQVSVICSHQSHQHGIPYAIPNQETWRAMWWNQW